MSRAGGDDIWRTVNATGFTGSFKIDVGEEVILTVLREQDGTTDVEMNLFDYQVPFSVGLPSEGTLYHFGF